MLQKYKSMLNIKSKSKRKIVGKYLNMYKKKNNKKNKK